MDVSWMLIQNRNIVLVLAMLLPFPFKIYLHVFKYTTLDELYENYPGLTIDVFHDGT